MISSVSDGCLGVEASAAGTVGLLVDARDRVLRRVEAGPGHFKMLPGGRLAALLEELAQLLPEPTAIAIGMAGAITPADFSRIRAAALEVWPRTPCLATNEFEIARVSVNGFQTPPAAPLWVVAAAGSACFGQGPGGRAVRVGGWGHWLGDKASGYDLGLRALKAVLYHYDQDGIWPQLGRRLLRALQLNEPGDLIGWVRSASPSEIRRLGLEVMRAWRSQDRIAADIVAGASAQLANNALVCARRIARAQQAVNFLFAPGAPLNDSRFAARVTREVKRLRPGARIQWAKREAAWGAVELARSLTGPGRPPASRAHNRAVVAPLLRSGGRLSPTEQRHPRSRKLDRMPLPDAIRLMLSEDAKIPGRLLAETARIEQAVRAIARAFRKGGRLFYVGAGTSGRLGVLDASECPPTFRSEPETVQGIIAGGAAALSQSIEGAEDDEPAGRLALEMRGVTSRDVVVGIAASGTTPFVWGALNHAIGKRATSILVCFNPHLVIPRGARPSIVIAPSLGPEVLTGSTRLKAGTATKLLLNIFTTLAMVRVGKVISNLMVDLRPSNAKLRGRAIRIVQELAQTDPQTAQAALERSGWNIKKTISRLR